MTYSSVVDKLHEAKRAYLGIVVVGGGGGGGRQMPFVPLPGYPFASPLKS